MPTFKFTSPDGKQYTVNGPEGSTDQQAFQMLQSQIGSTAAAPAKSKPFGQQMNEAIADIPRQIGLTARYGLEGVGNTLDFMATPFRAVQNAIVPDKYVAKTGIGGKIADAINLPQPTTAGERIVGDAARTLAGAAVPIGISAKIAQGATGVTKAVSQAMAAQPLQQLASASAAGAAGGSVRESGGNAGSQLLASLAAGVATPYAIGKAQQASAGIRQIMNGRPQIDPAQIETQINNALQPNGITLDRLAPEVQTGIRNDVADALKISGTLKPDELRRLADYRMTGTTPTAGTLTLDPAVISQQKNLAKLGINSKDEAAQQLGRVENSNNRQLIDLMNNAGAKTSDTALTGAQKIIGALNSRNTRASELISDNYAAARATNGRSAELDPHTFTNRAADLLHEANVESFLTPDIRNKLNGIASGQIPLTVDVGEQLKTSISAIQRNSSDGNVRKALSSVRTALDETPLQPGQEMGQESIDAFNKARSLHRAWMGIVEKTPALQAVRDGIEPDKFVQQFITSGGPKANVSDLAALRRSIKGSPEAMTSVKEQITSYLKKSALNGAEDEVGNVSQSAYNKALNAIGDTKLSMFFTNSEVDQLKAIGRVASYEQFQPRGSAVNNSNTASAGMSAILDRIANSSLLSKIPLGKLLAEPVQNISAGIKSAKALNAPASIAGQNLVIPSQRPVGLALYPALIAGHEDDKK